MQVAVIWNELHHILKTLTGAEDKQEELGEEEIRKNVVSNLQGKDKNQAQLRMHKYRDKM